MSERAFTWACRLLTPVMAAESFAGTRLALHLPVWSVLMILVAYVVVVATLLLRGTRASRARDHWNA